MAGFFSSWTTANWVSVALSLLLFVAGFGASRLLAGRQGQLLKEVRDLQEAQAELEIREKIGVIAGRVHEIEAAKNQRVPSAELARYAMNVKQDSLSVLPVFKFASERLQIEYRDTLGHALWVLRQSPHYRPEAEAMFRVIGEHLARLEREGLVCAAILRGALTETERGVIPPEIESLSSGRPVTAGGDQAT